jgi:5'-nucleotidase
LTVYVCEGTPCDCVKIAFSKHIDAKPDLLLSGINHGGNSSVSVLYSGTMAAAIEGCMYDVPSIGFSLLDFSSKANFSPYIFHIRKVIESVIAHGVEKGTCLSVNIPKIDAYKIKGFRICRQARGHWLEEFEKRIDTSGREYFWLTGEFHNSEPNAEDTDEWALENGYISVVPIHIDMTHYPSMEKIKKILL